MIHSHRLRITPDDSQSLAQQWAMLSHWIWMSSVEIVALTHGDLWCASGCEPRCAMLSHWLWNIVSYAESLVVMYCELCTMCQSHYLNRTHSYPMAQHSSQWITTNDSTTYHIFHNHWLGITHHGSRPLAQPLWNIVCYAEPVVLKHCVLCWASDCESSGVILSRWLWIMMCYAEQVVVNHGNVCWAIGCESCFTTTGSQ
jgi:hypothetical protein